VTRANVVLSLLLATGTAMSCGAPEWPRLWQSYTAVFLDSQVRVIDRDAGDRTTSEGQAYAMFFALVANDRARFDGLLRWTELNLASGDLTARLPAWWWGRGPTNQWGVLDDNSASDADVWMAYTLLEAGDAWGESRYTRLGTSLAERIAAEEVVSIPGVGPVLLPAPKGFRTGESYRLNTSYMPLQLFIGLGHRRPDGPWQRMAERVPALVRASAPHGFATDWITFTPPASFEPSPVGSYEAIRVYLWAGLLDPATPGHEEMMTALGGMARHVREHAAPPEKVDRSGRSGGHDGPVGFSAALLPYLASQDETRLERQQLSRLRSAFDANAGLFGRPAKYYDQNLALFALGARERQFWFDAGGKLRMTWTADR
jgi:endo-1,4-beta-D-glucanase Y